MTFSFAHSLTLAYFSIACYFFAWENDKTTFNILGTVSLIFAVITGVMALSQERSRRARMKKLVDDVQNNPAYNENANDTADAATVNDETTNVDNTHNVASGDVASDNDLSDDKSINNNS